MNEYMYKSDLIKTLTDLVTENKLQEIEIDKNLQENKELIANSKVVTKEELKVIDSQLAENTIKNTVSNQFLGDIWLNTFDGNSDALHPSVVYIPAGFNGFKYWLVCTPLSGSPYVDRWECPDIFCSNDGSNFKKPIGLTTPIDDLTASQITNKDYFSDPTLIYNNELNRLECVYRYTYRANVDNTFLIRKTSTDGVVWSDREIIFDPQTSTTPLSPSNHHCVSPQMIFKSSSKKYRMYYQTTVDNGGVSKYTVFYAESDTLKNNDWINITKCTLYNTPSEAGDAPWHFGVSYNNGKYEMLGYDAGSDCVLYYTSNDGVNFYFINKTISGSKQLHSDVYQLYQAVPVKVDDEWKVYCSIKYKRVFKDSVQMNNCIGLFSGYSLDTLSKIDCGHSNNAMTIANDIILANNERTNSRLEFSFITMESEDKTNRWGFGTNKTSKAPIYRYDNNKGIDISVTNNGLGSPLTPPKFIGQTYIDTTYQDYGYYFANYNNGFLSNWSRLLVINNDGSQKNINNNGKIINNNIFPTDCTSIIDATNKYKIFIQSQNAGTKIENIIGEDNQEIVIINRSNNDITIKNVANGNVGLIRLKGQTDLILKNWEAIRLIRYSTSWIQEV